MFLIKIPRKLKAAEGLIEKWIANEAAPLQKGDVLFSFKTADEIVEIRSPQSATLLKIVSPAGSLAAAGQPVGILGRPGDDVEGVLRQLNSTRKPQPEPQTAPKEDSPAQEIKHPVHKEEKMTPQSKPTAPAGKVIPILMPQAGQTMEEGTLLSWKVKEGDRVEVGQILFEIETDKATMEVEAVDAGRIAKIVVPEGQTVEVKTPVAYLAESDQEVQAYLAEQGGGQPAAPSQPAPATPAVPPTLPQGVVAILMPQAGQTMEEGTLLSWKVKEGDRVEVGQILFEIETDKATMEVEAVDAGRLSKIVVFEGQTVDVKVPVAYLAEDDAAVEAYLSALAASGAASSAPQAAAQPAASESAFQKTQTAAGLSDSGRIKASPAARKIAAQRGMDLAAIPAGSGPGGRILSADVEGAKAPAGGGIRRPLSKMRRAIAGNLLYSKQNVPHFYAKVTMDAQALFDAYKQTKEQFKCSVNDFVTRACAKAIRQYPAFRSRFQDKEIVEFEEVNIGIAVGTDEGLTVPVVLRADTLSLKDLAEKTRQVVAGAREGKLEGIGQGVFTITNLGMFGVEEFSAIINPPESAILAVGAIREGVRVENGQLKPTRLMTVTLSSDHRVIDGVLSAQFLQTLKEQLENPASLLA